MTHATSATDPHDKKKLYFTDTPQRRAPVAFARSLFRLVMRMEVTGLEKFPRRGPVILAANLVTNFDVFPMQCALPRPIFFMGQAELFKNPLMAAILRNLRGFLSTAGRRIYGRCVTLAQALPNEMRDVYAESPKGFTTQMQ